MKKFRPAVALLLSLILLTLCGCSVNISFGDNKDNGDKTVTEDKNDEDIDIIDNEPRTDSNGSVVAPNAKSIRTAKALKIYQKAAESVKRDSVGFKKTQWQNFSDINIGEPTGIADMVLSIVSKNVVKNNSRAVADTNPEIVAKGNTASVREKFPLFGSDFAYVESDELNYISGAEYIKTDTYKEYYIYFSDALNPVLGEQGFGGVMTPFDRNLVLDGIKSYGFAVDESTLKFDCLYTGSYMMFRIDNSGKLVYLEQNMFANIDAKAELNLLVASTNFLNGTCKYEEHYIYSEFTY